MNTEGRVQIARQAIFPPGEAKEDWKIIRALSEALGKTLPYNTGAELRAHIADKWKTFTAIDELIPEKWGKFGDKGKLEKEEFASSVKQYYLTNPIARASKTMRECQNAFAKSDSKEQIAEAAE